VTIPIILSEDIVDAPVNPRTGELYGFTTKAFAEWAAQPS
jgi:hypothetical protein